MVFYAYPLPHPFPRVWMKKSSQIITHKIQFLVTNNPYILSSCRIHQSPSPQYLPHGHGHFYQVPRLNEPIIRIKRGHTNLSILVVVGRVGHLKMPRHFGQAFTGCSILGIYGPQHMCLALKAFMGLHLSQISILSKKLMSQEPSGVDLWGGPPLSG
ncbi:unnamed protein product [Allacma fusca]|uniref:Uncharacterized protein n=1 Tax=Allacma fusca TaxID=39272 RepID=A0A8J2JBT1_9HEXA|nr:unnamed protein product [Allacma fusca]